eukprot:m.92391 g.92391  ORF g.92391 m.92391 type:complete len:110 (-) comp14665_c0_seq6:81-410(-)
MWARPLADVYCAHDGCGSTQQVGDLLEAFFALATSVFHAALPVMAARIALHIAVYGSVAPLEPQVMKKKAQTHPHDGKTLQLQLYERKVSLRLPLQQEKHPVLVVGCLG